MKIAPDKKKHLAVGLLIGLVVAFVVVKVILYLGSTTVPATVVGLGAGVFVARLAGILKEKWDAKHPPHVVDGADITYTMYGGMAGSILGVLIAQI